MVVNNLIAAYYIYVTTFTQEIYSPHSLHKLLHTHKKTNAKHPHSMPKLTKTNLFKSYLSSLK